MSNTDDIAVAVEGSTSVDPQPERTSRFTAASLTLYQYSGAGEVLSVAAEATRSAIRHRWLTITGIWAAYYPRVAFGKEGVALPHSAFGFIINALLAFAESRSQNETGFPFQTHPVLIKLSVTSLIVYGLASAVELVVPASGLDNTSIFTIIARIGRIGSLCLLVAFLASLFYF